MRILLVEPGPEDVALAGVLEPSFSVTAVSSLQDGAVVDFSPFEGIVLGRQGPLEDRAERCRSLRDRGFAGAILALCVEATEGETLLDAGADDFVAGSCEARELVTRVRASTRRAAAHSRVRWGPLELDRGLREVRLRGRSIALTARECEMLVCLMEGAGAVVSRATLRVRVWQRKEEGGSNLVEVHLSRLREKLGDEAFLIETVRRAGYRLRR